METYTHEFLFVFHQGFELRGRKGKFEGEKRRGSHISPRLLGLGSRYEGYDEDGFPEKEC